MVDRDTCAITSETKRFGNHSNAFGFLRLLFASLVIVSHTPEIYYGNRNREILTQFFGSISFGEVAVNAFFVISGYLITASFIGSRTPLSYLKKRVARIYPGFLCAYLICVLIVAPIGGARMPEYPGEFVSIIVRALLLQTPDVGTVFNGTPYPYLNIAMWTISLEFKCYLLIFLIGCMGLLENRSLIFVSAALLLTSTLFVSDTYHPFNYDLYSNPMPNVFSLTELNTMLFGNKKEWIRLTGIFLAGSCFYLFRDKILFKSNYIILAIIGLSICLSVDRLAHLGTAVFGGYLIFAVAEINKNNAISQINNVNDVSYGVYLYAFPITKVLILFFSELSVVVVGLLTFGISYALGWISWLFVEKPIMSKVRPASSVAKLSPIQINAS